MADRARAEKTSVDPTAGVAECRGRAPVASQGADCLVKVGRELDAGVVLSGLVPGNGAGLKHFGRAGALNICCGDASSCGRIGRSQLKM